MARGRLPRRYLLAGLGLGAGAFAASEATGLTSVVRRVVADPPRGEEVVRPRQSAPPRRTGPNRTVLENQARGAADFRLTGRRFSSDTARQIQGYTTDTSVEAGGQLGFKVSVAPAQNFRIQVYRVGDYAGAGARLMTESPRLRGATRPKPVPDPATGLTRCDWPLSWTLRTGRDWTSGYYLALLVNDEGYRAWIPFLVREPRRVSDLLVVVGTSTYQAYNRWPLDEVSGKSLYYGYTAAGTSVYESRSRAVSHDRPYSGNGLPKMADQDIGFVRWLEGTGYDLTYASSEDLHAGRVRPEQHQGVVFASHDEYWSPAMRQATTRARDAGTSLAFMTANNVYWKIGYAPAGGVPDRIIHCPKKHVISPEKGRRELDQWRASDPEQQLLGTQYITILRGSAPLVVRGAGHWFWAGTGVRDGDRIPYLVTGEADHQAPRTPLPRHRERVLLSASPFTSVRDDPWTQHTQLYQAESGAWVFVAGTFGWPPALYDAEVHDDRVEKATQNLFGRMVRNKA